MDDAVAQGLADEITAMSDDIAIFFEGVGARLDALEQQVAMLIGDMTPAVTQVAQ